MKRAVALVLVAALLFTAIPALAFEPQTISDWAEIRQDMELFKGALERAAASTVLNAYLPGYGVVFLFTVKVNMDLDAVRYEVERALQFITPTISRLPEGEVIAIVGYKTDFRGDWELMYISQADSSTDPETWTVYLNRK